MDFRILKRKLEIGNKIDDFLDNVSESGLLFKLGVDSYLKGNRTRCQPGFSIISSDRMNFN